MTPVITRRRVVVFPVAILFLMAFLNADAVQDGNAVLSFIFICMHWHADWA